MVTASKTRSLTKQSSLGIDNLVTGIFTLETGELELFIQKIRQLIALRQFDTLSERESDILFKIYNAISPSLQEQYKVLSEKLHFETITPAEHKKLLKLVDKLEAQYVKRLEYLIELAHIRHMTLDQLMRQLHLNIDQNIDQDA